ncbi:AraC-type DNA-binding protein [Paenibacillus sp. UNCCL117]|uniref:helix-turn-helix domain-containing protein n=1 Tax=unclassified Paenibacillus TaxID=185978 RepID=UPI0008808E7B|nr:MULTISPECIES: helix-turn-helix domain-containing protein [unclassified Paenibacillus]SDD89853.1 AraC-type DNA-binding protein [Paenibacillus sp. cl123]SFW44057.1 AraC-type DNA-binding protein [Paenibacillus sp. UNCCL117]
MKSTLLAVQALFRWLLPTHNYLKRLIWLGCISVAIPIVLAGSAYYHFSMKKLTVQFQEDNRASLRQLKDRVESALTGIEHESLQLASHPLLKGSLGRPDYGSDIISQVELLDFFQLHKNTNSLIQEIIFYDDRSATALSSYYGLARLDDFPQAEDIRGLLSGQEPAGWLYLPESGSHGYISYIRRLPIMDRGNPQGLLIIQVPEEALRELLRSYSISLMNQQVKVVDSHNRIILDTSGREELGRDAAEDPDLNRALVGEQRTGQYVLEREEGRELIAYDKNAYGRTYVSLLPEREMIEQLGWIRALIVFSVSIFLLIGMLLTFFSSKLAYNPIQKLLQYGEHLRRSGPDERPKGNEIEYIRSCLSYLNEQAESLDQYVKNVQPDLRERFLQKQLQGGGSKNRKELEQACRKFHIEADGQFVVLITKVENLLKEKRFLPHEGAVIVFAVKNVMSELLARFPDMTGYVVDKDEREAVAVIRFGEETSASAIRHMLLAYSEQVRDALADYLSFTVSTGIGRPAGLEELNASYKAARHALQFRLLHDADTILFYEDMIGIERHPMFIYPREIEESILELLWTGDLEPAELALQQFAQRMRAAESYNIVFQCYQVLLSSIIQHLEEKGPGVLELLGDNLFDQLKGNHSSQEMHDWFIEVLFPLYQQISHELRTKSTRLLIQRVRSHIANHPDGTHSLSECAELVGVSPSYLSRLFKKETGVSFIEYVMEHKVEKAKQLLRETDRSVVEIAEIVGYSERNLNRAFQRFVQMSPKQYRLSKR